MTENERITLEQTIRAQVLEEQRAKIREYRAAWREKNRERIREYDRNYQRKRKGDNK